MAEFTGRRVVIMGGSRGIGRSIALGFAREGAAVAICARGAEALQATRAELEAAGATTYAATADLASPSDIARFIPDAAAALGGINVLVNNASGFGQRDDEESWAVSVDVDLMAVVRASAASIPYLERAAEGAIINITSISAMRATKRNPPYGAIKAAVIHYTASQARMLAARGIRVNAVAPGSIEFPGGTWERRRTDDPALYNSTMAQLPFGRMGTPEEIADVVLFLAGSKARWITGQTITVDGGQLLGP
jgi:3-oxoacyl-[acyl-carrier protein] reductase